MNCFCRNCRQTFPLEKMKKSPSTKSTGRGICKKCQSDYSYLKQMTNRYEKGYTVYQCDDCTWMFSIKKESCSKCGSKNIIKM